MLQQRPRHAWLLGALIVVAVGCDRADLPAGLEASPESERAPALAKPLPGDAPKQVTPEAPEARPQAEAAHAPEPGTEEAPRAPKDREGRRRASSAKTPAVAAPEAAPDAPAATARSGGLSIKRIQLAEAIEGREPVDPEETFTAGRTQKLYAFVELANGRSEAGEIVVAFVPPSGKPTRVTLDVGAKPRWRTWAVKREPRAVGTWTVIVSDTAGKELGRRTFEVTE